MAAALTCHGRVNTCVYGMCAHINISCGVSVCVCVYACMPASMDTRVYICSVCEVRVECACVCTPVCGRVCGYVHINDERGVSVAA